MSTPPLWRPFELADLAEVAKVRVGNPRPRTVTVVPYDEAWPAAYAEVAVRVRAALGDRVLDLQHVGSTAVPDLAAKPVIDVDLTVADSADEAAYLPALEAAGFGLRIREPDGEEHRLLTDPDLTVNLHVFSVGPPGRAQDRARRPRVRRHDGRQQPRGGPGLRPRRAGLRRRPGSRSRPAATAARLRSVRVRRRCRSGRSCRP